MNRKAVDRSLHMQESCKTSHDPHVAVHFARKTSATLLQRPIRTQCPQYCCLAYQNGHRGRQQRAVKVLLISSNRHYPAADTSPIPKRACVPGSAGSANRSQSFE